MKDRSIQTLPRGSILRAIAICNPTSGPERQQSLKNKLLLHLQLVNIPSALSSRLLLLLVTATVTVIAIPVIGFPFCPRGQARWSCLSSSPAPQSPECYIISSYVSCYHEHCVISNHPIWLSRPLPARPQGSPHPYHELPSSSALGALINQTLKNARISQRKSVTLQLGEASLDDLRDGLGWSHPLGGDG